MRVALVGVVVGVRRTLCFVFHPHLLLQMKWQMTTIYDNDTAVGRAVVIVKAEGCKFETLHTHTNTHTHTCIHEHTHTHALTHTHTRIHIHKFRNPPASYTFSPYTGLSASVATHTHTHIHTHTHTQTHTNTHTQRETHF